METIETTYTVTLRDYPEELPAKERIAAETRYAKALESSWADLNKWRRSWTP